MFGKSTGKKPARPEINEAEVLALFDSFADSDDTEVITLDGIGSLCEALGIDASTDVRALVLMWRLGAGSKPGAITRTEFLNGMKNLRKDSLEGLRQLVPTLDPGFLERSEFRDFFRFVFQFSREGTHKTIEKDIVCALLTTVLDSSRAPHLEFFLQFLQQSSHLRITLDQWDSFLQFQHSVPLSLAGYDDNGAWPLLLDEYVEWRRAQK